VRQRRSVVLSSSGTDRSRPPSTPIALTEKKRTLLDLISRTPRNAPTPGDLTRTILDAVSEMEAECPTDNGEVITKLAGVWELLWTAQDRSRSESRMSFINPLENQSYSNNPLGLGDGGRANPILPRPIQDRLEKMGIISPSGGSDNSGGVPLVRSTQSIDPRAQLVRNVVSFGLNTGGGKKQQPASLTVTVAFKPDAMDRRRINVKFQACRVVLPNTPINFEIPLGIIGPTGWLRTTYIDDDLRITRGHKGSVFVLRRPSSSSK